MALSLVSRCDATFPTSWPVSLTGAVVGLTVFCPAGTVSASSGDGAVFGGNFGGTF